MMHSAILFGSIGTVAETSELHRRAFNLAFAISDLEWIWEPRIYYRMLQTAGGIARIECYARAARDTVDARAVHRLKEEIFAVLVGQASLIARPGVEQLMEAAHARAIPVAFCTTTSGPQVDLILSGLSPAVARQDFDWIGNRSIVDRGKPSPDIYFAALRALGVSAEGVLAIEDTPESAEAALAAGLDVIGFPGRAALDRPFPSGVRVVDTLDPLILSVPRGIAAE